MMSRNCVRLLRSVVSPKLQAKGCVKCCCTHAMPGQINWRNSVGIIQRTQVRGFSTSRALGIDYTPKQMVVTTNTNVWAERPEGVQMSVTYVDTAADVPEWEAKKMPTILATHGSPGNHKDILTVIEPLAKMGARVIMPNFPGYDLSYGVTQEDEDFFTHTTEERVQFLLQILSALNVTRVDMLLCHSAASWPLFFMASMMPNVKGIAMICPGPGHTPPRSSRPEWFMAMMSRAWDHHWLRPAINLAVRILVKPISGIGYGKVSHIVHALRTAAGFQFSIMPSVMEQIKSRQLSMLQFMCKRDVLIEYDLSKKSAEMLGFPEKAVDFYDSSGKLESRGEMPANRYVKRVVFDLKTHYPMKKDAFFPIIEQEVTELYRHITSIQEEAEENQIEKTLEKNINGFSERTVNQDKSAEAKSRLRNV